MTGEYRGELGGEYRGDVGEYCGVYRGDVGEYCGLHSPRPAFKFASGSYRGVHGSYRSYRGVGLGYDGEYTGDPGRLSGVYLAGSESGRCATATQGLAWPSARQSATEPAGPVPDFEAANCAAWSLRSPVSHTRRPISAGSPAAALRSLPAASARRRRWQMPHMTAPVASDTTAPQKGQWPWSLPARQGASFVGAHSACFGMVMVPWLVQCGSTY